MKVITPSIPIIYFAPRFYPVLGSELTLSLDIPFSWTIEKNLIKLTLDNTDGMIQRENYSFTVTQDDEIVYNGKIIFLKDGTDIQNYTNQSQDNKRWQ